LIEEHSKKNMATYTPPPYFPQNIAPPDPEEMRKRRMRFYGCIGLLMVGLIGALVGLAVLVKWLV
jgi:hypothetical protein